MATNPIRSATKKRLKELIAAKNILRVDGDPVQVSHGWPGEAMENESIWVGAVEGELLVPTMRAGRKRRQDEFTVDVWVLAGIPGNGTAEEAEERCELLVYAVDDVIADDPHLGGLDGLRGGAYVSSIEGPDAEPTDEGWLGVARVRVTCRTSLE
jgi:hypothetical protein